MLIECAVGVFGWERVCVRMRACVCRYLYVLYVCYMYMYACMYVRVSAIGAHRVVATGSQLGGRVRHRGHHVRGGWVLRVGDVCWVLGLGVRVGMCVRVEMGCM